MVDLPFQYSITAIIIKNIQAGKKMRCVEICSNLKIYTMGIFSYFVALLLTVSWAVGLFAFQVGPVVHVLLAAALVVILLKIIHIKKSA